MTDRAGWRRGNRLVRAIGKPATERLGLHVRPYTDSVQGLDPWRDVAFFLNGEQRPTILDVGANRGQSTRRFSSLWPQAEIHSFEPSPATFRILEQNVKSLRAQIHTVNVGVGSRQSRNLLLENSHSDMSSFLEPAGEAWGNTTAQTPVTLVALDDYCEQAGIDRVELLKSDTQGYDLEVLRGADRLLSAGAIRLIFLEVIFARLYEGMPAFDVIYRFLVDRGYRFVGMYELHHTAEGYLAWCDVLFAIQGS